MPGNSIVYWLFYARVATVHVSAVLMIFAVVTALIYRFRLSVSKSIMLLLFVAGLHEAIFNPVWIIYFQDWTVFNNLQTLYLFKFVLYFAFTAIGLKYFFLDFQNNTFIMLFILMLFLWIGAGLPTSVPLPNGAGNVSSAGNYWEFGYNVLFSLMTYFSIKKR